MSHLPQARLATAQGPAVAPPSTAPDDAAFVTYVINLDSATTRWTHMQEQLTAAGLKYVRVPAVDGSTLGHPHPDFSDWSYRYLHGRRWAARELGCYLSHIQCLRLLLDSTYPYALILEDDVVIDPGLPTILRHALECKEDWNMLRLSTVNHGKWWRLRPIDEHFALAICLTREKGAGAYLVDRKAAAHMLRSLLPMRLAWDIAFDLEWLMGFRTMGISPMPVSQNAGFGTQIQQDLSSIKIGGAGKYLTVLPFRLFLEITRLLYRSTRLIALSVKYRISGRQPATRQP